MAAAEGRIVLGAAGIEVAGGADDEERWGRIAAAATPTGEHRGGSSWQSLARATGSIEAPFFNGEIVLLGRLHGVAAPVNERLAALADHAARAGRPPGSLAAESILADLTRPGPFG